MIQDFLSRGISIPIGSSNKFTKKLFRLNNLQQPLWIDQSHMVDHVSIDGKICIGNFMTGLY